VGYLAHTNTSTGTSRSFLRTSFEAHRTHGRVNIKIPEQLEGSVRHNPKERSAGPSQWPTQSLLAFKTPLSHLRRMLLWNVHNSGDSTPRLTGGANLTCLIATVNPARGGSGFSRQPQVLATYKPLISRNITCDKPPPTSRYCAAATTTLQRRTSICELATSYL
jgi:hypothetical protein